MILNAFIFFWLILFLIFTWLAFSLKSIKVYLTGCITSLIYFILATEGIIYAFHNKVPIIGFLVNPFPGEYKPFSLNFQYHWIYFTISLVAYIFFYIRLYKKIKGAQQASIQQ